MRHVAMRHVALRHTLHTALCLTLTAVAVSAQPAKSGLTRLLETELSRFPARAGVYVKHLTTGEEAFYRTPTMRSAAPASSS
ncbi:MAG: hypothetical protein IPP90_23735 [Gemmatimonadaceae bacterium]|nr:hypothetical protein [Gemmatimonadaceae bacterium]